MSAAGRSFGDDDAHTRLFGAVDREALRDSLPIFVPAIPFGFVLGVAITESAMPSGAAYTSSLLVFAGAAQLTLVSLAGTVSLWTVALAAMVINLRHIMYSAALAPAFSRQPKWFRWLAPFLLIDQVFAMVSPRTSDPPERFRSYYLTCGSVFFIGWQAVTLLGIFFGSFVPASWGLSFAPGVMFVGIVVLMLDRRASVVAAVVAAVVCFVAVGLPNRSGLLLGAVCGIVAGFLTDRAPRREAVGAR